MNIIKFFICGFIILLGTPMQMFAPFFYNCTRNPDAKVIFFIRDNNGTNQRVSPEFALGNWGPDIGSALGDNVQILHIKVYDSNHFYGFWDLGDWLKIQDFTLTKDGNGNYQLYLGSTSGIKPPHCNTAGWTDPIFKYYNSGILKGDDGYLKTCHNCQQKETGVTSCDYCMDRNNQKNFNPSLDAFACFPPRISNCNGNLICADSCP